MASYRTWQVKYLVSNYGQKEIAITLEVTALEVKKSPNGIASEFWVDGARIRLSGNIISITEL